MFCTIIILAWNGEKYLQACLEAVLSQAYSAFEVIVVDNASTDTSVSIVQSFLPRVRLIQNETNLGYAGGNNVGLQAAKGDILVLLNQDTVVQPGWLTAIVDTLADETIGIVGCKGLYPDGKTIQHAGTKIRFEDAYTEHIGVNELDQGQYDQALDMLYVTGAAFALRRQIFEKLGGLDEAYYPAYYEEMDYCWRVSRLKFRIVYQPKAVFWHYETASLPDEEGRAIIFHRSRLRFVLRHWDWAALDKFLKVEAHSVAILGGLNDAIARAQAYFYGLMHLAKIVGQRRHDPTLGHSLTSNQAYQLATTLQALRQQALVAIARVVAGQSDPVTPFRMDQLETPPEENWLPIEAPPPLPLDEASLPELEEPFSDLLSDLNQAFADLSVQLANAQTYLKPNENPAPVSPAPILGWWVTRVRAVWLAVMVRPYLVPLLQYQWQYNAHLQAILANITYKLAQQNLVFTKFWEMQSTYWEVQQKRWEAQQRQQQRLWEAQQQQLQRRWEAQQRLWEIQQRHWETQGKLWAGHHKQLGVLSTSDVMLYDTVQAELKRLFETEPLKE